MLPAAARAQATSGGEAKGPPPLAATPLPAAAVKVEPDAPVRPPLAELHGYLQPQFGLRYRPEALPRDRWEYGGLGTRAGLIVSGTPVEHFRYVLYLSLDVRALLVLSDVDLVDTNGDGSVDALAKTRRPDTRTLFEEVTLTYQPFELLFVKMGAMRMPFTVAAGSSNSALMFPNRPGANEIFQSGSDQGLLAGTSLGGGAVSASVGVFSGTSLGLVPANTVARGLVYSVRVDAAPLGALPAAEVDFKRRSFRFGLGAGGLFRNGSLYTPTGYELAETRDARVSGSVRVAAYGLFVQAEALRRLLTDNVTSRPNQASGGYVQASFFVPLTERLGLAPIGRLGLSVEDEVTLPRRTAYYEAGVSFFPQIAQERPESVRFLVQYQGERRITDDESAHGVLLQAQVLF
jgi:hypothetical protein